MKNGSQTTRTTTGAGGLSRGDRRRNARLGRLREVVGRDWAVLAVDLADRVQAAVVVDHDSRVLARRVLRGRAWDLAEVLTWARGVATGHGFAGLVLACEPTGHRWRVLGEIAAAAGVPLVCVSPMLVARGREGEDLTRDKTDDRDAVVIARLTVQLRCYLPEQADPAWARLRHLGARRAQLITRAGAARQQAADLVQGCWPALLDAAAAPLDSATWRAAAALALHAAVDAGGDVGAVRARSRARFTARVARGVRAGGGRRVCRRVAEAVHAAAGPAGAGAGVAAQRHGALERAAFALTDLSAATTELAEVEARMLTVLADLGLDEIAASIPGVSPVGVAAILAESGDPTRFDRARALVKHAGLSPVRNESGTLRGQTTTSRRGRPGLRVAAWRATWGALRHNPVYAARHTHLTTRTDRPRLHDAQARTAVAAALLRQIHHMVVHHQTWDPTLAGPARDRRRQQVVVPTAA
ncbi:transposase [Pseudokineococcus basanitobsidens]|uniref:Transposase n=1 Tax=Pseudokineococcus basanitobsidens TaxID=1926649 RepID=A0ABU8RPL9_9ACTN